MNKETKTGGVTGGARLRWIPRQRGTGSNASVGIKREEAPPAAMGAGRTLLEVAGLKKSYTQGPQVIPVLKGVELKVAKGEFVAVVGSSGSGKSTLLHLLGGLDRPDEGEVRFEGEDLYRLSDRQRAQVRGRCFGFVFQFYHLVPELTALENVSLPAWIAGNHAGKGDSLPRGIRHRAMEFLKAVGLDHRAAHLPSELSGGEQQRVAIARGLINAPQLLLCDEPTGNLDAETGSQVLNLLLRLHREQGITLMVVTHEPNVTKAAGRVLTLRDGKLWA